MAIALVRRTHLVRRDPEVVLRRRRVPDRRRRLPRPAPRPAIAAAIPARPDRPARRAAGRRCGPDRPRSAGRRHGRRRRRSRPGSGPRSTHGTPHPWLSRRRSTVRPGARCAASPARWHPSPDTPSAGVPRVRRPTLGARLQPRAAAANLARPPPAGSPSSIWAMFAILALLADRRRRRPRSRATPRASSRRPTPLTEPDFSEQSVIHDRNGVELARFGGEKRDVVDVRGHPADRHRRPGRGRGQDLLGQRRLRPARDPVGRDRQPPRQQPRRVDDHPAARPPAAARSGPRRRTRTGRSSGRSRRSSSRSA